MKEENLAGFFNTPTNREKVPYTERLYDYLAPIPLDVYKKEMEHDFEMERQCPGCGTWVSGDDPFCSSECFNNYMDRQHLIKQAEQKDKTMKLMRGKE